jgi:hypothetical protein
MNNATTTNNITTLTYRQAIRLADWSFQYATLFTAEGFDRQTIANGYEVKRPATEPPSAMFLGTMLCDSKKHYAEEQAIYDSAVVIDPNETYMIEGKEYKVRIVKGNELRPRNSDPFYFDAI